MSANPTARGEGAWALVTGASSGLGRAFSHKLAAQNWNLVLVARRGDILETVADECRAAHGIACTVVAVDLAEEQAAEQILSTCSGLDVGLVVSNAGSGMPKAFLEIDRAAYRRQVRLNAISHLDLAHGFAPRFAARGGGRFIFVGALGASEGLPMMAVDGAAKAFLHSLGAALHTEFRHLGLPIEVTVLLTPPTDTPVIEQFFGASRQGLPMKPLSPGAVVAATLDAAARNKVTILPHAALRLLYGLLPSALLRRGAAAMFTKAASLRASS
jgi:uncharacterized protein